MPFEKFIEQQEIYNLKLKEIEPFEPEDCALSFRSKHKGISIYFSIYYDSLNDGSYWVKIIVQDKRQSYSYVNNMRQEDFLNWLKTHQTLEHDYYEFSDSEIKKIKNWAKDS
jgi:hypothetical protein